VLLRCAEPHDMLDAGAVVIAAIEDDDFASSREMWHEALKIHLRFLAVGRRRQRDDAEDARAYPLRDSFDRAALAGGIPAFEYHDNAQAFGLDPLLQLA